MEAREEVLKRLGGAREAGGGFFTIKKLMKSMDMVTSWSIMSHVLSKLYSGSPVSFICEKLASAFNWLKVS